MLHKLNTRGLRHIRRAKYGVRNWPAYNEALHNRGSLTIWLSPEALAAWRAPRPTTRGGQIIYSDLAIEMMLGLRVGSGLALRQTEDRIEIKCLNQMVRPGLRDFVRDA